LVDATKDMGKGVKRVPGGTQAIELGKAIGNAIGHSWRLRGLTRRDSRRCDAWHGLDARRTQEGTQAIAKNMTRLKWGCRLACCAVRAVRWHVGKAERPPFAWWPVGMD